ncbi:hypothetical protein RHGRI_005624 [Rhododendron griersonianum]|uniref:Uncharacterized protein n=1 Tax=Rhododendron griersonianum TaxID=479676 RepID=A0AAV6LGC6_9ERIC|nr:hypothetical protein RHGRI_005624 [Rhododendron griersonianum]
MPRLQIADHRRTPTSFEPQSLVSISNAHEGLDHHGRHTPTKRLQTWELMDLSQTHFQTDHEKGHAKKKMLVILLCYAKKRILPTLNGAMQEGEHKAMQEWISFLQNYYCPS